ncbi:MAG: hypothetical protein ABI583_00605 [Betaproteobacteria bacterium]
MVVKSGSVETRAEAFADIVSTLDFKEAVPGRWEQFANSLAALRTDLAQEWPEHNTSGFLQKIVASGASWPPERGLFATAFKRRRLKEPIGIRKPD